MLNSSVFTMTKFQGSKVSKKLFGSLLHLEPCQAFHCTILDTACTVEVVSSQPQLGCCGMQRGVIGWPRVDQPVAESLISLPRPRSQSSLWEHTRARSYLNKLISMPRLHCLKCHASCKDFSHLWEFLQTGQRSGFGWEMGAFYTSESEIIPCGRPHGTRRCFLKN